MRLLPREFWVCSHGPTRDVVIAYAYQQSTDWEKIIGVQS